MRLRLLAASFVFALGGAGVARAGERDAPSRETGALVAKVIVVTSARSRPGGGELVWRVPTKTAWGHGPQQLLVLAARSDRAGREWLRVQLPIRPNRTSAWIRADHVLARRMPWWIEISLSRRVVTVYRAGRLMRRFSAVVGAPATPTPSGLFAVWDPIEQPRRGGFLGPWVIHLTAFSNVLDNYGGGPGRVAIHGRGGASFRDPLGSARSHGCIRVDNAYVSWLARALARGTPVRITR